jgi:hypothetical protein
MEAALFRYFASCIKKENQIVVAHIDNLIWAEQQLV